MFKQIFLIRLPMISLLVPHTHVSEYINIANGFKTLKPYIFHIFHINIVDAKMDVSLRYSFKISSVLRHPMGLI